MKQIFRLGVEKIAICTHAIENPDFIKKTSELFGKQSVVIAIDVKKDFFGNYTISTFSGKTKTEYEPCDFAILAERMGAGEILVNSIDRDGTMRGYDINLIKSVSDKVNIPVIACGGAGGLEDFRNAVKIGNASAVAAGSFFIYQGKRRSFLINVPERINIEEALR